MRKIVLILLAVFAVGALSAFNQGTINPGGYVAISSEKSDSDDDATTSIVVAPQIGYFVIDNLAVDLLLNVGTASQSSDGYDYSATSLGIGLGARYFFLNFYGGLGFNYESFSTKEEVSKVEEKYSASAMYITPKIGYVLPLASNVYADFGLNYRMGIGKAKGSLEVANVETEWDSDNEYSKLQLMAGLQIFFPKK
ncbi:MAG TPA: hypothetical protein PK802_03925 [Candidatus Cloacimonadota bacterium]|jgi:hypothetical protein|nr:hypothetical protein [Candidatus Cloacimonadota bacterium]HOG31749.1 hypothetical protein [Candidatus Cloacimonadota bacterium]HOR59569.1 hypothetical protein [Candidatus Cloacimonadota bacterium]HPB08821.1 hypothetical protein [Candidatus Cloacimonadota bacterium]HPL23942.1 hypothetical protein [Candidatus Cloacimonadota bacterium]